MVLLSTEIKEKLILVNSPRFLHGILEFYMRFHLILFLLIGTSSCHLIDKMSASKFTTESQEMKVYDFCDSDSATQALVS